MVNYLARRLEVPRQFGLRMTIDRDPQQLM